ncbi:MAG: sigma-70 family RNA polymerase sigma factor, partial [Nocardioidaceae bacterium]
MAPTTKISEHDHTPLSLAPAMSDAERSARTDELLEASAGSADVAAEVVAEVVRLNLGIARSIAMRYRNRGVAEDDLVQVAYLGLVKAIQGFDPTKGGHFLAYAVPTIRGEIKRFFRDSAWVVRT